MNFIIVLLNRIYYYNISFITRNKLLDIFFFFIIVLGISWYILLRHLELNVIYDKLEKTLKKIHNLKLLKINMYLSSSIFSLYINTLVLKSYFRS